MAEPIFRLTLDAPAGFATEPGHIRTAHCADFRVSDVTPSGCFRDPQTGIVMLTPSVMSESFQTDFQPLSAWTVQSNWWRSTRRAVDPSGSGTGTIANMMATIKPAGGTLTLIQLLSVTAILATYNSGPGDTLVWAAQSTFTLGADQGFAIHYQGLNDEMLRQHNWFGVKWGGLLVHLDANGIIRTHAYPGGDESQTPVLVDEFNLSHPGEIYNRPGYFWFLPVPGIGLLVYHSLTGQFLGTQGANASSGAVRGHLVKLPSHFTSGVNGMLPASVVCLALNPYLDYLLGFQNLTFPASGTFTDSVFDPGYAPSMLPSASPVALPTAQTGVSVSVNKPDNSAAWAVGDQQARAVLALSTTNSSYTPFAYGYQVSWPAVSVARTPTPLVLGWADGTSGAHDRMTHLEFSDDEYARFEGSVELILGSAHGRLLAERGDATFHLEKSFDAGATWLTHAGGLAKQSGAARLQIMGARAWYQATWTLMDFWARLDEIHETKPWAVDGLSIGNALNAMLETCGFPALATLPAAASTTLLPPVSGDQQFSFAPRVGDAGSKIASMFLIFLRRRDPVTHAYIEYRLRFDWDAFGWVLEIKPQDMTTSTNVWTLSAFADEEGGQVARFSSLDLLVQPPEFNKMVVKGVSGTTANEAEIVQSRPVVNGPSLTDATSPDYLGRLVTEEFHVLSLSDQHDVDIMAMRLAESAGHRRLQPRVTMPYYVEALRPLAYVTAVRAVDATGARAAIYTALWVKRRSLAIDQDGIPQMTLELDDQWLGEMEV